MRLSAALGGGLYEGRLAAPSKPRHGKFTHICTLSGGIVGCEHRPMAGAYGRLLRGNFAGALMEREEGEQGG